MVVDTEGNVLDIDPGGLDETGDAPAADSSRRRPVGARVEKLFQSPALNALFILRPPLS